MSAVVDRITDREKQDELESMYYLSESNELPEDLTEPDWEEQYERAQRRVFLHNDD